MNCSRLLFGLVLSGVEAPNQPMHSFQDMQDL